MDGKPYSFSRVGLFSSLTTGGDGGLFQQKTALSASPRLCQSNVSEVHVGGRPWLDDLHDSIHRNGSQLGGVLGHNLVGRGHMIVT